jgi:carboxy-terminal domain RNA polymerase II polypeptide A small phosphatase
LSTTDDSRKLLILDLDETLLYATEAALDRPEDFRVYDYFVYLRPFLDRFVQFCLAHFRVAVWTSSGSLYAAHVVDKIFPSIDALEFVWSEGRCTIRFDPEDRDQFALKPLKKVRRRGYNLEQVLVIDDTPKKHQKNYGNLIPVREYHGSLEDNELLCLEKYLITLEQVPNVRAIEKRWWRHEVGCS